MTFKKSSEKGFTLIELLVVVAIISLLSSVVLASLNGARMKARNTKRAQDLRTMQTAIELYRADNGNFPIKGSWICSDCTGSYKDFPDPKSFFKTNFGKYISQWPTDPTPVGNRGSTDYGYLYTSDGKDYALLVYGTVEGGSNLFSHGGWNEASWVICSSPSYLSFDQPPPNPPKNYCR